MKKSLIKKSVATVAALALAFSVVVVAPASALAAPAKKPAAVKSVKVAASKNTVTVKWAKQSAAKADGYQVRFATDKAALEKANPITVKKAATNKAVLKKLKTGTTYYVQVCAYKKSGKKTMRGPWSKAKAVTVWYVNTGDKKLDEKVVNILKKNVKKTGEAGLKKAFDYVVKLPYGTKGATKAKGKWQVSGALKMINNKGGNCYESAALFCWLAKGLGYDAKAVSGKTSGRPHGWVEIKKGGKWYVCDPNNTNTLVRNPNSAVAKQIVEEKGLALDSCLFMQPADATLFVYSK